MVKATTNTIVSMASTKPLLVVLGATGIQGGSVISHFLSLNPQPYKLRGISRNPASDASKALIEKGVEMVAGDLDDPSSLLQAFQGANVIFSVTDFWGPYGNPQIHAQAAAANKPANQLVYEIELQHNKNVFDAASQISTLDRLIHSTLSSAKKWSKGKYQHVYHFDSKADAVEYAQEKYPELLNKTSELQVGFYLSNFFTQPFLIPTKVGLQLQQQASFLSSPKSICPAPPFLYRP